jgi:hypothetical protein
MPNVIALAFHVDYWDNIGWRDHYSIPNAVGRQHRYVEALGLSSAFTPQAVVDGRSSFVAAHRSPGNPLYCTTNSVARALLLIFSPNDEVDKPRRFGFLKIKR